MRKYILGALILAVALVLSQVVPSPAGFSEYSDSGALQQAEK